MTVRTSRELATATVAFEAVPTAPTGLPNVVDQPGRPRTHTGWHGDDWSE